MSALQLPPLSLYVHIPWCQRKCPYCDFNSHTSHDALPETEYVDALIEDLEQDLRLLDGLPARPLTSIFFGGGTPSLFSAAALDRFLQALNQRCTVALYTDSEYVRKGITEWIAGWKRKGWKTAARKPVKNADLWRELDELAASQDVEWHWVKGHSGDVGNEKADELANQGIDALLASGSDIFENK